LRERSDGQEIATKGGVPRPVVFLKSKTCRRKKGGRSEEELGRSLRNSPQHGREKDKSLGWKRVRTEAIPEGIKGGAFLMLGVASRKRVLGESFEPLLTHPLGGKDLTQGGHVLLLSR